MDFHLPRDVAIRLIQTRLPWGQVRAVHFKDAECDCDTTYDGVELLIYLTREEGTGNIQATIQWGFRMNGFIFTPAELGIGPRSSPRL